MRLRLAIPILLVAQAALAQRVAFVFIDAPSPQLTAHDSFQVTATAYDANNNAISNAAFTWASSDTTSITVDGNGNVQGVGLGWADISATAGGVRATVRVQVVPLAINVHPKNQTVAVGAAIPYAADVLDVNSQPMSGVNLQWRVYAQGAGPNNGASVDGSGVVHAAAVGSYYVEAYFNYTVGAGPFIPRFFGNTQLTVTPPSSYTAVRLLDSGAARQSFSLRARRGMMSVNDSGQVAYTGSLEGFATAALVWSGGAFTPVAAGSTTGMMPGAMLMDIDDPAFNNNGEIAAHAVLTTGNILLFGAANGAAHMLLSDGSSGGGVTNIRNFQTTRFSLNDSSLTLFRADYENIGGTTFLTGLFTVTPAGNVIQQVPGATPLDGLGANYTFDRDFGIDNAGNILFFARGSNGARVLYRMTPDQTITRVIGMGDKIGGNAIVSLSNVAVGKGGQYAVTVNNGQQQYLLLYNGDPAKPKTMPINWANSVYAIGKSGEALGYGDFGQGFGLYRCNGTTAKPALLTGTTSPIGDLYTQFDSGGIDAKGEVIAQARTANNLLLVVKAGPTPDSPATILFQTGTTVNAAAGPAFQNLVLNSHAGNPMIKTATFFPSVFEVANGALVPRLVDGDMMPGGWFYEGAEDTRRSPDGSLVVSTDDSINLVSASASTPLGHFPQRSQGGQIYTGYQVAANSAGTVAITGGTSFGVQAISLVRNGAATPIAYLGTGNAFYRTVSPGGGFFNQSFDIGMDESGNVYANMGVSGGPNGLFEYTGSGWTALLKIGDTYDGRAVTGINGIRVAGSACAALIATSGNVLHLAIYQGGAWTDLINSADGIPTGGSIGATGSISNQFDLNRNGAVAAIVFGSGKQYLVYADGSRMVVAAQLDRPLVNGEYLASFFTPGINDDGRIFCTGINLNGQTVLYEFDPQS
ncbi:MAG TPA: Ig-like domain-containing protein [Bryobacteraceae bacterium]|jgi:hypothetical protein|nr:Ig-like domain-containing protein [Bryobacteraceae bacterium]